MWYGIGAIIYFTMRSMFKAMGKESAYDTFMFLFGLVYFGVLFYLWWSNRY